MLHVLPYISQAPLQLAWSHMTRPGQWAVSWSVSLGLWQLEPLNPFLPAKEAWEATG